MIIDTDTQCLWKRYEAEIGENTPNNEWRTDCERYFYTLDKDPRKEGLSFCPNCLRQVAPLTGKRKWP
jgi:hypothetical protein